MLRFASAFFVLLLSALPSFAQATDATVCDVLSHPENFNGKIVRIKGQVVAGFDQFQLQDYKCTAHSGAIWLAYPEGTKAKSGPAGMVSFQLSHNNPSAGEAVTRTPIQLTKDKEFKNFDSLLSAPYKGKGICLGCTKNVVNATLVGRLDTTDKIGLVRDAKGQVTEVHGFGNMNRYYVRMVIQSVSEATAEAIDYSKTAVGVEVGDITDPGDAFGGARKAAAAYPAGSQPAAMQLAAVDAYGKPNENNGVIIAFRSPNEVPNNESAKNAQDSPDGLAITVIFNKERIPSKLMTAAIAHLGLHVADHRNPDADAKDDNKEIGFYESRGWYVTTGQLMAFGVKDVVLPGGFESWNASWKQDQLNDLMNQGISQTLAWVNQRNN